MKREHRDFYSSVYIPVPTRPLDISATDTTETVCAKIDAYFDDIISGYPNDTQKLLRNMYYKNKDVVPVDGLMEGERAMAVFSCGPLLSIFGVRTGYKVEVDSRLISLPITSRWLKVHEIAGHVGQDHQRINQVGYDAWLEEWESGAFKKFTEQSVGLSEWVLLKALPVELLLNELQNIPYDSGEKSKMLELITREH